MESWYLGAIDNRKERSGKKSGERVRVVPIIGPSDPAHNSQFLHLSYGRSRKELSNSEKWAFGTYFKVPS